MHDLVHDLARLTVADELEVFEVAPQRNTRDHKYCRYSMLRKYDGTMKLSYMPPKLRALRFLVSEDLDIPSGAFSFAKFMRTLDFSECSGIMLPDSIGRMKQLRCLIAPRMKNDILPEFITELSKLQCLNIHGSSKITELSIGKLGCLKHLCLSGCSGISKLADSFCDLKCMVHLDMSGCSRLTELPDSFGNLTNLHHLELSGCSGLKALPQSLCGLTQLQYLNLSSCECLDRLPEAIGSLMGLQYLKLSSCEQIRELPGSMVMLQNLLHLDLSRCTRMQHLGGVHGLTALQHLDMSRLYAIDPQDLCDSWPNLTNLKYLNLHNIHTGCGDGFVPLECIGRLTNLEHLNLSSILSISSLPDSIGNLKKLHTLDISYCCLLESLPMSIGTLGLKSLVLEGCSDELLDQASSLVNYMQILPVFKVRADDAKGCSNLHLLECINVSELRILGLENVRSLEEGIKVKLSDKHNLSKLTLDWNWGCFRKVHILEDKDLLEQLVPPTGLKSICLEGYSCVSFPGWFMCIHHHLTNLISVELSYLDMCTNLPPLGQLPHLEKVFLIDLPRIKRIDRGFCGGKGAFRRLLSFHITSMEGLEEWHTTYFVEDGVEEFMFPVLDDLNIADCPRLRLKPCPPTFRECSICASDQVISSLGEVYRTSHHCSSPSQAIKLELRILGDQSLRILHHFPALRELALQELHMSDGLKSVPESIRHLTSLESLTLGPCKGVSALPEWLSDLSSLKSLVIEYGTSIKSLPSCIQQLTKLQKIEIHGNRALKEWCESEENKAKLAHINVQFIGCDDVSEDKEVQDDDEGDVAQEACEDKPISRSSEDKVERDEDAREALRALFSERGNAEKALHKCVQGPEWE